tara:strand:+ start:270 stop:416 length:147 start_codon:yes stop_codon:yes gene_type:complete
MSIYTIFEKNKSKFIFFEGEDGATPHKKSNPKVRKFDDINTISLISFS